MKQDLEFLYSFWIWFEEIFGFGNLGTIHVVNIENTETEKND